MRVRDPPRIEATARADAGARPSKRAARESENDEALGYSGELIVEGALGQHWFHGLVAMKPFRYIIYVRLVGLADARYLAENPSVEGFTFRAQWVTVLSWWPYLVLGASVRGFTG